MYWLPWPSRALVWAFPSACLAVGVILPWPVAMSLLRAKGGTISSNADCVRPEILVWKVTGK